MEKNKINETLGCGKPVEGFPLIAGYLGVVAVLSGIICLLSLLTLFFYSEELSNAKYFVIPGVSAIIIGYLMTLTIKGKEKGKLQKNQDAIIVVSAWIIGILTCAMPFVLTGKYSFTQAVFEATSGFSTTGLSVVDVAVCPHIFLMHRSVMLFFGGVGLVLVMTSAMSDAHSMRLYNAEGHSDKLLPNLAKSARLILAIYAGYIAAGTVLYIIFGMPVFDAINHSIAAISTGGFSTQTASIGAYNSLPIELITIILMLLGATNFFVHLLLLKGKLKAVFTHCETKLSLFFLALSVPVITLLLCGGAYETLPENLRTALFQAVSALTTTGFQTVPTFTTWSSPLIFIMILLMLVGGSAGSTAGGIKQYRVAALLKILYWNLRSQISNKRSINAEKINRYGILEKSEKKTQFDVIIFIGVYLLVFISGTFMFCLFGYPLNQSMFEFSSALGTVGLSVGITAYGASPVIHWTAVIGMFVGRLEIYVVFAAVAGIFGNAKAKAVNLVENKK